MNKIIWLLSSFLLLGPLETETLPWDELSYNSISGSCQIDHRLLLLAHVKAETTIAIFDFLTREMTVVDDGRINTLGCREVFAANGQFQVLSFMKPYPIYSISVDGSYLQTVHFEDLQGFETGLGPSIVSAGLDKLLLSLSNNLTGERVLASLDFPRNTLTPLHSRDCEPFCGDYFLSLGKDLYRFNVNTGGIWQLDDQFADAKMLAKAVEPVKKLKKPRRKNRSRYTQVIYLWHHTASRAYFARYHYFDGSGNRLSQPTSKMFTLEGGVIRPHEGHIFPLGRHGNLTLAYHHRDRELLLFDGETPVDTSED